jgi:hypothetical protein
VDETYQIVGLPGASSRLDYGELGLHLEFLEFKFFAHDEL